MVGLIWFVQLVHYPLLSRVGDADFVTYEAGHVQRTSWVVIPLMLAELLSSLALVLEGGDLVSRPEALIGLALLAGVWASTFFLQVPLHQRLGAGFAAFDHERLVQTNGIRTALWSARGVLVLSWLGRGLG
tara:strand:+ start:754 stop:1146 length:393 start_codon:yes stop_codon:yes gene_type:complete